MYRVVEIKDGATDDPVNYVGVHPVKWSRLLPGMDPDKGFAAAGITRIENCANCKLEGMCPGIWTPDDEHSVTYSIRCHTWMAKPISPEQEAKEIDQAMWDENITD